MGATRPTRLTFTPAGISPEFEKNVIFIFLECSRKLNKIKKKHMKIHKDRGKIYKILKQKLKKCTYFLGNFSENFSNKISENNLKIFFIELWISLPNAPTTTNMAGGHTRKIYQKPRTVRPAIRQRRT